MDDFLLRALLGGLGVALAAGPLGAFIVWRRMAYFGDTLAHSGLLGVALGMALQVNPQLGVAATCLLIAIALVLLQRQRVLATDTLLGILAHTSLSLGLVTLAFLETVRIDLASYLFGDILAISPDDLYWIWGGAGLALAARTGASGRRSGLRRAPGLHATHRHRHRGGDESGRHPAHHLVVDHSRRDGPTFRPFAGKHGPVGRRTGLHSGRRGTLGVVALGYSGRSLGRGGRRPSVSAQLTPPQPVTARGLTVAGWAISPATLAKAVD